MLKPLREVADVYYGQSPVDVLDDEGDVPVVGTGGTYAAANKALFDPPAVVVPRKGSLGNPQLFEVPCWPVDTTYAVIPKSGVDAAWLYYNLFRYDLTRLNEATGVPSISRDWLVRINFEDPGPEAQRKIGSILRAVDLTLCASTSLIRKYQNIQTGLMHNLFSRGLDAGYRVRPTRQHAPELYKQSSVGWIPRHWVIDTTDSLLADIIDYRGKTPQKSSDGIPLITARNIRMGYVDPEPREYISESTYRSWMTRGIPSYGDVLITMEAPLGNVAQVETPDRVAFAQRVIILQPNNRIRNDFLKFLLMTDSVQRSIVRRASGTTALGIKQSEFRKVVVAYPDDAEEQKAIVSILRATEGYLRALKRSVRKRHQQKSGVAADLLTGLVPVNVDQACGKSAYV